MNVYPCPICGRWRDRRGTLFTDESRTMSHITDATDDPHRTERGEEYWGTITPIEIDESRGERTTPAQPIPARGVTIDPDREPVPLITAVEENGQLLRELENAVETNERLRDRIDELEDRMETIRADVAGLYAALGTDVKGRHIALSSTEERGWLPESIDPHDPTGEFEDE